jgi:hypothetical protein
MCTFEHCQSADKQYSTRRDWKYHEVQTHRRQWICKQHDTTFSSQEAFSNHIFEQHMSSIASYQLPVLIEMSERPMDDMTIVRCPLCPDERRLMTLHSHIAEHLEAISLFVLPLNIEEDNQGGDNSDHVADGDFSSRMENSVSSMSSTGDEMRDLSGGDHDTYVKIAVMIIRWDDSLNDLQGMTEEVSAFTISCVEPKSPTHPTDRSTDYSSRFRISATNAAFIPSVYPKVRNST